MQKWEHNNKEHQMKIKKENKLHSSRSTKRLYFKNNGRSSHGRTYFEMLKIKFKKYANPICQSK